METKKWGTRAFTSKAAITTSNRVEWRVEGAMQKLIIVPHGDSAAVVLPTSVLESIGARVGDVLEAMPGGGQLILRPVGDPSRQESIEEITHDVFNQRRDAYQRLA
jgi:antitoxin component of MazEF toxin-antitoxin module